jgi:hypothetical protein
MFVGTIVRLTIDICLFQKGPQHLPHSPLLFYLSVFVYSIAGFVLLSLSIDFWTSVLQLLVEILLMCGFAWATLKMANHAPRFLQTATALFATDTLITLIAIPVFGTMSAGGISVPHSLLALALMIWHWLVTGHIFRHAVSTSFAFGLCLALMYIIGSYQIMTLLFSGT